MKTTFSRTFSTTVIILLLSLILVGTSFQALVEDYLAESAIAELQRNSTAVANLASAYSSEGGMLNRALMVNLDVVSAVSDSDILICDAAGKISFAPIPSPAVTITGSGWTRPIWTKS